MTKVEEEGRGRTCKGKINWEVSELCVFDLKLCFCECLLDSFEIMVVHGGYFGLGWLSNT